MDDISSAGRHYRNIAKISVSAMILILQVYLLLLFNGLDLYNFLMIESLALRSALQILIQIVLCSFLYALIYFPVKALYCASWKRKNKDIWLKGIWLHIHVKRDIRVGTVRFEQDFCSIKAEGHNYSPCGVKNKDATAWEYTIGRVFNKNEGGMQSSYEAFYSAMNLGSAAPNKGLHSMKIVNCENHGPANYMVGHFRDTFRNGIQVEDAGGHMGTLYMFRPSKRCLAYLRDANGIDFDKLCALHLKEEFRDEPYVRELRKRLAAVTEPSAEESLQDSSPS